MTPEELNKSLKELPNLYILPFGMRNKLQCMIQEIELYTSIRGFINNPKAAALNLDQLRYFLQEVSFDITRFQEILTELTQAAQQQVDTETTNNNISFVNWSQITSDIPNVNVISGCESDSENNTAIALYLTSIDLTFLNIINQNVFNEKNIKADEILNNFVFNITTINENNIEKEFINVDSEIETFSAMQLSGLFIALDMLLDIQSK